MPYFNNRGARVFYDDVGAGPLVIAMHGMMSPGYWPISGVAGLLGLSYRVASIDLRGHGRTEVSPADEGFDADVIASDIDTLANHLGEKRFHLLGHATGGMAALRYAMRCHERLLSLITMDTSAETAPMPADVFATQSAIIESTPRAALYDMMRKSHAGMFLTRLETLPHRDLAVAQTSAMFQANDPAALGRFMRSFFSDPDPHLDLLRKVSCPTLAIVGEHDPAFIAPAQLLAETIPGARLNILPGVGHMTAFEDSLLTFNVLKSFLDDVEANLRK